MGKKGFTTASSLLGDLVYRRKALVILIARLDGGTRPAEKSHGSSPAIFEILPAIVDGASLYVAAVERFLHRYAPFELHRAMKAHEEISQTLVGFGLDAMMGKIDIALFERFLIDWMDQHDHLLTETYHAMGHNPANDDAFITARESARRAVAHATQHLTAVVPERAQRLKPRHRILHIEDNLESQRMMQSILGGRDDISLYATETARSGLDHAFSDAPELILLDIGLPDMDGYDALKALKAFPRTTHVPVIGVSAHPLRSGMKCGSNAGFAAYVTKPFDVSHLVASIDTALFGAHRAA